MSNDTLSTMVMLLGMLVFKIMITISVSSIVLRLLPVFNQALVFLFSNYSVNGINFVLNYSIDLNFPFFLILTICVHKSVRRALLKQLKCSNLKRLFGKPSNQVSSSSEPIALIL